MKSLKKRIKDDSITMDYHMLDGMSEDGQRYLWNVALYHGVRRGRVFELPDPYVSQDKPTVFDVLDLLTSSCSIVDQCATRDEWASEYVPEPKGGEPDESILREAWESFTEDNFRTWKQINEGLRNFFGPQAYEDYLYNTDRSK
ncbi:hypothetical protein [Rhodococcus qingshengii]|uniref:hypothetical protein n=1 Tax=Rhodococcus qingshengii TaxID=334542 RepID=UPI0035E36CC6